MSDTTPGEWLTLIEACRRAGVSEKTLRKRITGGAVIGEKITLEGGGQAWRVRADSLSAPEVVPEVPNRAPEAKAGETVGNDSAPEVETVITEPRAGTAREVQSSAPEGLEAALLAEKDARIADLRATVEAQRAQIEALNRDGAEVRAALRSALKLHERALPAPGDDSASVGAQDASNGALNSGTVPTPPEPAQRRDGLLKRAKTWLIGE
jgi:hypothetical protein